MRGNHVLKVVAHASPPLSSQPGFRQYNFFVNGQSFFTFPKVFRLGLSANDPRGVAPAAAYGGGGYETMGQRSQPYPRSRSDNIASLEAPHDREEVRLTRISFHKSCSAESDAQPFPIYVIIIIITGGRIPQRSNQNVVARIWPSGRRKRCSKCSRTEWRSQLARLL